MQKVLTAKEMQDIDRKSIEECGIPAMILMENAGRGCVEILKRKFPDIGSQKVVIFCGKGNNGGDGFVIARHLFNMGSDVLALLIGKISDLKADAKLNAETAQKIGVEIQEIDANNFKSVDHRLRHCHLVIDAIFGTGLTKPAAGFYEQVFAAINQLTITVVSIDIPSGVDSDSGQLIGAYVEADLTLALALLKRSHVLYPAAGVMGEVELVDIGIPRKVIEQKQVSVQMVEKQDIVHWIRKRPREAHKGDFGHVLVIAGSLGKGGAAGLTALGALRAGCGLVTLAIPESCQKALEFHPLEVMTVPLPETRNGTPALAAKELLLAQAQGKSVVAIGPGISTNPETVQLLQELLPAIEVPLVIDADGVNGLAQTENWRPLLKTEAVLTPHPKEMSRISGRGTQEIQNDRVEAAARFAKENSVYTILKGARTLIAFPDGSVTINPTGNPGMATAGSGDVLTGIIAGLIAQGLDTGRAAVAGTYLHGLSGDIYVEKFTETSLIASDLLECLPESLKQTLS